MSDDAETIQPADADAGTVVTVSTSILLIFIPNIVSYWSHLAQTARLGISPTGTFATTETALTEGTLYRLSQISQRVV